MADTQEFQNMIRKAKQRGGRLTALRRTPRCFALLKSFSNFWFGILVPLLDSKQYPHDVSGLNRLNSAGSAMIPNTSQHETRYARTCAPFR